MIMSFRSVKSIFSHGYIVYYIMKTAIAGIQSCNILQTSNDIEFLEFLPYVNSEQ